VLDTREPAVIDRYRFDARAFGDYENVWFADGGLDFVAFYGDSSA
jgi:hypothetical protein